MSRTLRMISHPFFLRSPHPLPHITVLCDPGKNLISHAISVKYLETYFGTLQNQN
jgi:hypothetical protein